MARKRIPKKIIKEIDNYLQVLEKKKIPLKKVFLFGSYAKGTENRWSDIDLCIVSPHFRDAWGALQYLRSLRIKDTTPVIEPVGFHPKDMEDVYDSLIHEIKTTGIEVSLSKKEKVG